MYPCSERSSLGRGEKYQVDIWWAPSSKKATFLTLVTSSCSRSAASSSPSCSSSSWAAMVWTTCSPTLVLSAAVDSATVPFSAAIKGAFFSSVVFSTAASSASPPAAVLLRRIRVPRRVPSSDALAVSDEAERGFPSAAVFSALPETLVSAKAVLPAFVGVPAVDRLRLALGALTSTDRASMAALRFSSFSFSRWSIRFFFSSSRLMALALAFPMLGGETIRSMEIHSSMRRLKSR
mmetsp:Transcript_8683/g.21359  ORF Transcript_8683/g.21359 Transcript_8683/m.21359 type:complete len:236 (-) Transcript_8683:740-1447(-)